MSERLDGIDEPVTGIAGAPSTGLAVEIGRGGSSEEAGGGALNTEAKTIGDRGTNVE